MDQQDPSPQPAPQPAATTATNAAATAERAPRSVAVLGSCITRDNFNRRFNPDYKRWFTVASTTNQSSMIALMSPPYDVAWEPLEPMVDYGVWNVDSDLSREILRRLVDEQPDLLVLDFFGDVHFGVLRTADGHYLTNNRWKLHKTDLYARLADDPGTTFLRWQDDPDGYLALWSEAMDRFAAHLAEHCPHTRVVLHCGFEALATVAQGSSTVTPFGKRGRRAAGRRRTAFWRRLHDHAREAYGWEEIDLGREHYATFADHPWGAMEVHYTLDYYPRFLAELHRIVLRHELDPDLAAVVDEIAEGAGRRVRAEVEWWRARKRAALEAAAASARPRWKRVLRPARPAALAPQPSLQGEDRRLLDDVRERLDADALTRVESIVASADRHIAWLREFEGSTLR